jgi:hypothetical protein
MWKLDVFIRDITYNYFIRKPELFIFCISGYEKVQKVPVEKRF